jgi:type IV secretory pathway TraG/TraD family ATPase VirD4
LLVSTWMRTAIFQTMSQGESERRLWFVVDELDALGAIDGLSDALARLRKFGGRCVLGFQSIAQVSGTYGAAHAHTIVENCANTLLLRCSASEGGGTAQFAARLVGEREVEREQVSRSRAGGWWLRAAETVSRSRRRAVEPALLAAEIERLPDLAGYLKLASAPDWSRVELRRHDAAVPARGR